MAATPLAASVIPRDADLSRTRNGAYSILPFETLLRFQNRVLTIVVQIVLRSLLTAHGIAVQHIAIPHLFHDVAIARPLALALATA